MLKVRVACWGYAGVAVGLQFLPPLFPLRIEVGREVLLGVLAGALVLLGAGVGRWRRWVVLGLAWMQCVVSVGLGFVIGDGLVMFATWVSVPILAKVIGRVGKRGRKALVAAHVVSAAGWVGCALAVVAMAVIALRAGDPREVVHVYELMSLFDITLLPWTNFATTLTGIALGLTTQWGIIRYYWVAVKLGISISILVMAFAFVEDSLTRLIENPAQAGALPVVVLAGFGLPLLSLVGAVLLSLYKPGGKTRWGQRAGGYRVRVGRIERLAEGTIGLELRSTRRLPKWEPGAHVDLVLPSGKVRQYSLYDDYRVAVLKEPGGRGGSVEIHGLEVGDKLRLRGPRNHFRLVDAESYLFVAGGIGITPFLPMIRELEAAGRDWRLVYRGRSIETMAFADELKNQYPERVQLSPADTHPRPDLADGVKAGTAVYCCGPESLIEAVAAHVPAHATFHTERFTPSERSTAENTSFEAELRASGVTVVVPPEQSLLGVIQGVNDGLEGSCEDGVCGSCEVRVLAGLPEHRDDVLQDRDRTDVMYPCVSRAKSDRIVLDV